MSDVENDNGEECVAPGHDNGMETVAPIPHRSRKGTRVCGKGTKSSEYTAKDLLILSQAFICISEDAIEGVSHKTTKFWDDVAIAFRKLKGQI